MASEFSTYTKEELIKKLKKQKNFFIIKMFVILLMVVFAVFSTIENGISFHTFLPLFFIPMSIFMYFDIRNIKKELALRK
ncbi:hypothetical protein [Polaribacter atrinae]|uniref:Redox-active disulfide protein 2 n=1 Tax=Polaribacter atrinae TaxID=1333662 RepID=A0A176TFU3_9FLAO|nr:hypothetical protein [Polaribacter atrinae]OAD46750.1 hypothetical protein LPB303_00405 [Polaribacter atrinae]